MALLLVLFILLFALLYIKVITTKDKTKLPGPIKWPIVGNIIDLALADATYPHLAMAKLSKKYGEIMSLKFGVHNACLVSSYEATKEIFSKDEMTGRYSFPFVPDRAFHKSLGIIWSNGIMWRDIRRFSVKGLREFGFGKSHSMEGLIEEEIAELISHIKSCARDNNGEFEVNPHTFAGSIINLIWCQLTGWRFPIGDESLIKLLDYGNRMAEIASYTNIYNAMPYLRHWFPKWTNHHKHMKVHEGYHQFMKGIISSIKEKRSTRGDTQAENFVEVFLDEIEKTRDNPDTFFTEEQLIIILMDVFLAGSETTGNSMAWLLLFLAFHPEVQCKLKEEVSRVMGDSGRISVEDFAKMPYTKATLCEGLRLGNVVPIPPPREALADYYYKGYKIPKGTMMMFNTYSIFMDKRNFDDPESFRPERFLNSTCTKVINTEKLLFFGTGKRVCMGETLVWDAMTMFLAHFMKNFTFEVIPGREPVKIPVPRFTLGPQRFTLKVNLVEM